MAYIRRNIIKSYTYLAMHIQEESHFLIPLLSSKAVECLFYIHFFFSRHSFFRIFFIANVLPSFVLWRKRAKNTFMSFHLHRMFDVMIAEYSNLLLSHTQMICFSYLIFSIFSISKLFLYYSIFIAFHCSYKALICQIIFISCKKRDLSFLLGILHFIKFYN